VGKHRLIPLTEALRVAKSLQIRTDRLDSLAADLTAASPEQVQEICKALLVSLKTGHRLQAKNLIIKAYETLGSASQLADLVIAPVMQAIGHAWSIGAWDVFEEHQASLIVGAAISELISIACVETSAEAPIALGSNPQGDVYTLPLLLAELTLFEMGWNVKNLGANLPIGSLIRAIETFRPRLIFIAAGHLVDPICFLEEFPRITHSARIVEARVIVGGSALNEGILKKLGDVEFGASMADLDRHGRSAFASIQKREFESLFNRDLQDSI
jgi:methanogenic corrinoid protein MtbC1